MAILRQPGVTRGAQRTRKGNHNDGCPNQWNERTWDKVVESHAGASWATIMIVHAIRDRSGNRLWSVLIVPCRLSHDRLAQKGVIEREARVGIPS